MQGKTVTTLMKSSKNTVTLGTVSRIITPQFAIALVAHLEVHSWL
jgi:hypothetical protein